MGQISSMIRGNRNSPPVVFEEDMLLRVQLDSGSLSDVDVNEEAKHCNITWYFSEPCEVGNIVSFTLELYFDDGRPYPVTTRHYINVKIENYRDGSRIPHFLSLIDARQLEDGIRNKLKVSFNATQSGVYAISLERDNIPVHNSPFLNTFLPGPISPSHTILNRPTHSAFSVVISQLEKFQFITIDAKDEYGNNCFSRLYLQDKNIRWNFKIYEASDLLRNIPYTWTIERFAKTNQLKLKFTIHAHGIFKASLSLDGTEIINGGFDLIVTNELRTAAARSILDNYNLKTEFKCFLTKIYEHDVIMNQSSNVKNVMNPDANETKPVVCKITREKLMIIECFPNAFLKPLYTYQVCPATKMLFDDVNETCDNSTLIIDDGLQSRVVLSCDQRNVLASLFFGILHKNMGFSCTFKEKAKYFGRKLCKHHKLCHSRRKQIKFNIDRSDLLRSSFKALKNISDKEWHKQFVICFENELGLDWGGVSREWNHLLCKALFDPQSENGNAATGGCGMFRRIKDDPQALVLPNSSNVSGLKIKYYEFAGKIVGKCLLESAIGEKYARQVAGRFTRSFLAQLIDLPVTYKCFENDDPELYKNKVKFILNNDVNDMEISFSVEVYNASGTLERIVELVPHGENIAVTNENKHKYLTKLAQYRFSESIKPEIQHFIKGLRSIVPKNVLNILDEKELELFMCGMRKISVEDMKAHVDTEDARNHEILDWFWTIVSGFNQDELAQLLQFTTGSSQLPPDGFKALFPTFKISILDFQQGGLPTAHTCFNNLCIPNYECYEDFHRMLKIAITEGATGFGFI